LQIPESRLLRLTLLDGFFKQIEYENGSIRFSIIKLVLEIVDVQLVFVEMPIDLYCVHIHRIFNFLNFYFELRQDVRDLHDVRQVRVSLIQSIRVHLRIVVFCSIFRFDKLPDILKLNQVLYVQITQAQ
jgi:hypothetical protein